MSQCAARIQPGSSLAGAEFQFFSLAKLSRRSLRGTDSMTLTVRRSPGRQASDAPIETATANTVVSGTYSGGQIAMKIVKQAEFDYFMGAGAAARQLPSPST